LMAGLVKRIAISLISIGWRDTTELTQPKLYPRRAPNGKA
jgi:hypothetical protein